MDQNFKLFNSASSSGDFLTVFESKPSFFLPKLKNRASRVPSEFS